MAETSGTLRRTVGSVGRDAEHTKDSRKSIAELQGKVEPEPAGRIKVFSSQALKEILVSSADDRSRAVSSFSKGLGGGSSRTSTSQPPASSLRSGGARPRTDHGPERSQYREEQQRLRDIDFQKQRQARIEHAAVLRERSFQELYERMMHERETVVREIGELLENKDMAARQRTELLYRHWCEHVFDPIQAAISDQVNKESIYELERRKRRDFEAFLQASNTRALFRDIVIPSEYDALEPRRRVVKYDTRTLSDPVKKDVMRSVEERRAAGEDVADILKPHTRRTLEVATWSKLESTPFYDRGDRPLRPNPGQRSHIVMDHYAVERSADALRSEFPRGKRVFPDWQPGRTIHEL